MPYGNSKYEGEDVLRSWYEENPEARSLIIVRPTVVFGEGNRGNVYNLLRQISSGRFLMIGNGRNRKSMAYVGNVAAFIETAVEKAEGYVLYNYVDKPDFDMNKLVYEVRQTLRGADGVGIRIPYSLGLLLGYFADGLAQITGKSLAVSSIRVKKFCATTAFASRATKLPGFEPPFELETALERTVVAEFINPDSNCEEFFTE